MSDDLDRAIQIHEIHVADVGYGQTHGTETQGRDLQSGCAELVVLHGASPFHSVCNPMGSYREGGPERYCFGPSEKTGHGEQYTIT